MMVLEPISVEKMRFCIRYHQKSACLLRVCPCGDGDVYIGSLMSKSFYIHDLLSFAQLL